MSTAPLKPDCRLTELLLGGILFILVSCVVAISNPPSGYELSIYGRVSIVFWISTCIALSLFSLGLYWAGRDQRTLLGGLHLMGLTMANIVLVALPFLTYRTYYTGWDVWFHLGQASRIAITGQVDLRRDVYPGLHILWAAISSLTGISVFNTGLLLGPPLEAFRVPLVYLLTRRVSANLRASALAATLASIPDGIVGTFPAAWFFALALLPLALLLIVLRLQAPGFGSTILFLVIAIALAISHPLGPVFLIGATAVFVVWTTLSRAGRNRTDLRSTGRRPSPGTMLGLIGYTSIIFLTWVTLLTTVLEASVAKIAEGFASSGVINPAQYGGFLTPTLVWRIFGGYSIIGLYWLFGLFYLSRIEPAERRPGAYLAASMTISGLVLGVVFEVVASESLLGEFFQRPFDVVVLFLPIVAAIFLRAVHDRMSGSVRGAIAVATAYLVPLALVVPAMFPSPYVALYNYQNTRQTFSAVDWTAAFVPGNSEVVSNSYVGRYAYYGFEAIGPGYAIIYHSTNTLPANESQLVGLLGTGTYMILDRETVVVAGARLRSWDFPTASVAVVLRAAMGVAVIYDTGEAQIFLMQPIPS